MFNESLELIQILVTQDENEDMEWKEIIEGSIRIKHKNVSLLVNQNILLQQVKLSM